jgi:hypothetical protein
MVSRALYQQPHGIGHRKGRIHSITSKVVEAKPNCQGNRIILQNYPNTQIASQRTIKSDPVRMKESDIVIPFYFISKLYL